MKRASLWKALGSAVWLVLPGALISLLLCTLILGSGIFEMLLPVWLVLIFTVLSFVRSRVAFLANHAYKTIIISAVIIAITVIGLHLLG